MRRTCVTRKRLQSNVVAMAWARLCQAVGFASKFQKKSQRRFACNQTCS